jgi:polysaccharide biosynthesis transport protein
MSSPSTNDQSQSGSNASSFVQEVSALFNAIRRRWWWIALATAAMLTAALLFLMFVTPRYVATAQILIDPRAKRIVEGAVVPGGYGSSASGADTLLVDSQVELIQSSAVIKKIVEAEKLQQDEEFALPRGNGGLRILLRNSIGRLLFGNAREAPAASDIVDNTVWRFTDKHLRVRRLGNTYVINVSVMSQDPAKAARLANAVALAYITDQVRATGDTTREATTALQSRIVELRKRVETAENAVETFRTKAGLIGSPNLLVTEQQLQQTNDKLILARSQTALAKARYEQVRDLSVRGGAALIGSQSDALKSPVIANLRAALSRVERREAVVQQTLRPGHPEYASAQIEKRAVLTQIEEELSRIKANAKGEFELAQSNETSLTTELKTLEGRTASGNQLQVRLRELQREALSARTIFEQFLNRAKETSEQENLGRENSRIISDATVPPYPTFPPTLLILGGALMAGLAAGAGTAWLAHVFSAPAGTPASAAPPDRVARAASPIFPARPRGILPDEPQADATTVHPRPRLRRLVAKRPGERPPFESAPKPATEPTGMHSIADARTAGKSIATLARLPAIGGRTARTLAGPAASGGGDTGRANFSDHIAAVDDTSASAYPGYREAIDAILAGLAVSRASGRPVTVLLVGTGPEAGASSTALAIAYRSAVKGMRTLLVDVSAADARLSNVFAAKLEQRRPCVLDSEAHLAEITLHDTRTGLCLLPIALADIAGFTGDQQRRLVSGLRQLGRRFDLVVLDAGSATQNQRVAFLAAMADKVLVVSPKSPIATGLSHLRALDAAQKFQSRAGTAAIIETSAG